MRFVALFVILSALLFGLRLTVGHLQPTPALEPQPSEQRSDDPSGAAHLGASPAQRTDASRPVEPSAAVRANVSAIAAGTITVADAVGRAYPNEDGWLDVRGPGGDRRVEVDRGNWQLPLDTDGASSGAYSLERLVLRGRVAELVDAPPTLSPGTVAWRARWAVRGTLRVVDRVTGLDLDEIEIVRAGDPLEGDLPFPSRAARSARSITYPASPIAMPDYPGDNVFWVRATGYAWARIPFSGRGPARTVELEPTSALSVSLRELRLFEGAHHLRLRQLDRARERVYREDVDTDVDRTFEGLAPGRYAVELWRADRSGPERRLDERFVSLGAGAREHVTLDGVLRGASLGHLEGTVVLPTDYPYTHDRIVVEPLLSAIVGEEPLAIPLHRMSPVTGTDQFTFRISDLTAGAYRVRLLPVGQETIAYVRTGTTASVELAVERFARVRVWVQASDLTAVSDAGVLFGDPVEEGQPNWERARSFEPGLHEFACQPGPIVVHVRAPGRRAARSVAEVRSGPNDLAFELDPQPAYLLEINAQAAGAEVPLEPEFWASAEVRGTDHDGRLIGVHFTGEGGEGSSLDVARVTLGFDRPGSYELEFLAAAERGAGGPLLIRVPETGTGSATLEL